MENCLLQRLFQVIFDIRSAHTIIPAERKGVRTNDDIFTKE